MPFSRFPTTHGGHFRKLHDKAKTRSDVWHAPSAHRCASVQPSINSVFMCSKLVRTQSFHSLSPVGAGRTRKGVHVRRHAASDGRHLRTGIGLTSLAKKKKRSRRRDTRTSIEYHAASTRNLEIHRVILKSRTAHVCGTPHNAHTRAMEQLGSTVA